MPVAGNTVSQELSYDTIGEGLSLIKKGSELASYVVRYHQHLMLPVERIALRHLEATAKMTHGRTDMAAQLEAKNSQPRFRELLSDDPEVVYLTKLGLEEFLEQTSKRILAECSDQVVLNRCPKCGALARTPKARQCYSCHHDWHETPAP
jgi:hypothetical protein